MASTSSFLTTVCFFAVIIIITTIINTVSATEFQVGATVGWRIPATNESELYNVWASRRRFHIGDSLRFRYKNDSVTVVEKWGFYHCDSSNPIAFFNDGDTIIDLDNVGTVYFISGDSDRCKKGVKMMLEVMSPVPVRYFPPAISAPPENSNSNSAVAPAPAQIMSSGGSPEASPGPASSDSLSSVSVSVIAVVLGFGFGFSALSL